MQTEKQTHGAYYGPLMMLGAALLFSISGVLIKLVPWSPLAINGTRNLLAAGVMGIYLAVKKHRLKVNATVLFGALCMFSVTTLFVMANKLTTAANAIVLQYACPVWIILLMALLFHTKPTRRDLITVAVIFVGILCFFFDSMSGGGMLGNFYALLSGVFYAVVFMLNNFEKGDAPSSIFLGQLACGVLLGPLTLRETAFSPVIWGSIILLGVVQIGIAYVLFTEGTRYTPPVAASLIATVEPIMNPVWVAIFWGEMLQPLSLLGAVIVIGAVLVYNLRK